MGQSPGLLEPPRPCRCRRCSDLPLILAAALLSGFWTGPLRAEEEKVTRFVEILVPLIDPAKLDTLKGDRAANRRLRLIAYRLEAARREGSTPEVVIDSAQANLGTAGSNRGDAVKASNRCPNATAGDQCE
jgi:hypothetical protein